MKCDVTLFSKIFKYKDKYWKVDCINELTKVVNFEEIVRLPEQLSIEFSEMGNDFVVIADNDIDYDQWSLLYNKILRNEI